MIANDSELGRFSIINGAKLPPPSIEVIFCCKSTGPVPAIPTMWTFNLLSVVWDNNCQSMRELNLSPKSSFPKSSISNLFLLYAKDNVLSITVRGFVYAFNWMVPFCPAASIAVIIPEIPALPTLTAAAATAIPACVLAIPACVNAIEACAVAIPACVEAVCACVVAVCACVVAVCACEVAVFFAFTAPVFASTASFFAFTALVFAVFAWVLKLSASSLYCFALLPSVKVNWVLLALKDIVEFTNAVEVLFMIDVIFGW